VSIRDSWTEEKTRPDGSSGKLRASAVVDSEPPLLDSTDPLQMIGKLMAAQAVTQRDVGLALSEIRLLRRDLQDDRDSRKGIVHDATHAAARHGGNRSAAIVTALFALYEVSAPILHELSKLVHQ
jgi:hypothetical protein